ncbi:MAG: hypothetical protein EAZ30_07695 [Betaproteobacteria bacterium]|nr:MAG: hypothetical protein EAZ30_07695 [Betaproteobacteria bacterium]
MNSVKLAGTLLLYCFSALPVGAMTLSVLGDTMVLSGEIVRPDLDRVQAAFAKHPAIKQVVLRNSMGGNSWTGYRLGELFRERGVTTVVSGHCVSSCSRLFLGGKRRLFSDDYPQSLTYVGFHGHYDFGKLNRAAVEKNDQVAWTKKFTDNKIDPKLLNRWINIERRAGDVRFYPDGVATRWRAKTFLCEGTESRRPNGCEKLPTDAIKEGIVTSRDVFSSPDAANLPFKQREKLHPTTALASLEDVSKLPTKSATAKRDYELFLNAALPRALAISRDGRAMAWSANGARSIDVALESCNKKSAVKCALYAVDERIVWQRP